MNEILFELLKVVIMVAVMLITRYAIPWVRERIGADKLALAEKWVRYAVLKAQQVMWADDGPERKAYVTELLKELLIEKNIALSDEQLDILIEAAVKQMKIEAGSGVTINNSAGEAPGEKTAK